MSISTIPLTQCKLALVDEHNYDRLSQHRWKAIKDSKVGRDAWYAYREENGRLVSMQEDILGSRPGLQIDHRDGNGLNNCESNLRYASPSQNQANRVKQPNASSRYKGVTVQPVRYIARITVKGRVINLGAFEFEADAAKAYDMAARSHYGEFALLNFP